MTTEQRPPESAASDARLTAQMMIGGESVDAADGKTFDVVNPANGKVIWRTAYPVAVTMHPAATKHGPGPKSTPVFAGGKLFSIGMTGVVTASTEALTVSPAISEVMVLMIFRSWKFSDSIALVV